MLHAAPPHRAPRLAHLTTIDLSLSALLATELRVAVESGWDVLGISAPGPHVPDVEALGVTHVPIPAFSRAWSPGADARAAGQLWDVLRDLDLDVLHTHTPKAGVLGRILGRLAGIPVVVHTAHGLWAPSNGSVGVRGAVHAIEGLAALFSDAELYQNEADRLALSWAVRQRKSRTVGNGVDLERFRPDPAAAASVRQDLGVGPDELLVGGVGRLVEEKGIAVFARVARGLGDKATFVWVGPVDDDKPDAVRAVEGVRLLGMRDDMRAVHSALDVFVLPSHREGFSRSAMEAAACGTAMVLSDIPGCRAIGTHREHLLLAAPGDAAGFEQAVRSLLDDPDLRHELGAAARERALREFDQRRVAEASIETYDRIAARKGVSLQRVGPPRQAA